MEKTVYILMAFTAIITVTLLLAMRNLRYRSQLKERNRTIVRLLQEKLDMERALDRMQTQRDTFEKTLLSTIAGSKTGATADRTDNTGNGDRFYIG